MRTALYILLLTIPVAAARAEQGPSPFGQYCTLMIAALRDTSVSPAERGPEVAEYIRIRDNRTTRARTTLRQQITAATAALHAHGIRAREVLHHRQREAEIEPVAPGPGVPLVNQLAHLLRARLGGVRLAFRPIAGTTSAEHSPWRNTIYLPESLVLTGRLDPVTFHEVVHAFHRHLDWARGPHVFSGGVRNAVPGGTRSYEDEMSFGELGAFALELRLRGLALQLSPPADGAPTRQALHEMQQSAWAGARIAEMSRRVAGRVLDVIDGRAEAAVRTVTVGLPSRTEGGPPQELLLVIWTFPDGTVVSHPFPPSVVAEQLAARRAAGFDLVAYHAAHLTLLRALDGPARAHFTELRTLATTMRARFTLLGEGAEPSDTIRASWRDDLARLSLDVYEPTHLPPP